MMKANDFQHQEEMPEPVPLKENPFMKQGDSDEKKMQKEFIARLKERKEWQKPEVVAQNADKVFKEVKNQEQG